MKYKNKKSKRANKAKHFHKSNLHGKSCFKKTIYPTEVEAEAGATIVWSRDPSADRSDLHAYQCPDGCKINGQPAWHIGHKSYYEITKQLPNMQGLDVQNQSVA